MILIAGLGNPGTKYAKTRHNIGFMVLDKLNSELKKRGHHINPFKKIKTHEALVASGDVDGQDILLAKPTTFMNASGIAINRLSRNHNIPIENIWIICDDMDIPLGSIKIKPKGGSGGHNGLKSIAQGLKSNNFTRFRIGIWSNESEEVTSKEARAEFVLQKFHKNEHEIINKQINDMTDAIELALKDGLAKAMNKYNK